MDDRSFDRLARLLGGMSDRRTGLKALLGGILGAGTLAALDDGADAKGKGRGDDRRRAADAGPQKRKKTCKPACTDGHVCQKVGRKRRCTCPSGVTCGASCCAAGQGCVDGQCRAAACDPPCADGFVCEGATCTCRSGIVCGAACCATGQTCQDGTCAGQPEPGQCIVAGQPCKAVGLPCCDGRTCASGQGGEADVACYLPEDSRCARTADCVFGTECRDGSCLPPLPAPPPPPPPPGPIDQVGAACDPDTNVCTSPGATCMAYEGDHPIGLSGDYCLLPRQAACTVDADCSCYRCDYPAGSFRHAGGRRTPRADQEKTCCGAAGVSCSADADCCEDHTCIDGSCELDTACTVCKGGGCTHSTIAAAITAGVTDIRVAAGTYVEWDLPMPPGDKVRIRACGAVKPVIDAQATSSNFRRIMSEITTGKSVTFKRIAMKNGQKYGYGGCFNVNAGGALKLDGVDLSNCKVDDAGEYGGGVYSKGALTIVDSTVTGCTGGYGAGLYVYETGTLTMTGSSVTNCRTDTGSGGGIYVEVDNDEPVVISDSTIAYNSTRGGSEGGGMYVEGATVTMTRVSITNNRVESTYYPYGGGLYIEGGPSATLTDCVIEGNYCKRRGGGLAVSSVPTLAVTGGSISGNSVNEESGGGAYVSGSDTNATFTNVRISGNWIISNDPYYGGAGIYVTDADVTFAGTTRIENNQTNPAVNPTGLNGAGLYVTGSDGTVTVGKDTVISGNRATGDGGGIFVTENGTLIIEGAIRDNTAGGKGGGIATRYSQWAPSTATLAATAVISGNTAVGQGDGVYSDRADNIGCTGAPRVCENPGESATVADNCGGGALASSCPSTVCAAEACPA